MKINKFMIVLFLILIGVGVIIVFCKKEKSSWMKKVEMIVYYDGEKSGDEDFIICVRVKWKNFLMGVLNVNV